MGEFVSLLKEPWPWYVAGPIIGLCVPLLLLAGNKSLGISSSLRQICAAVVPAGVPFLQFDWKAERWNLVFVLGLLVSGFVSGVWLHNGEPVQLSNATHEMLNGWGLNDHTGFLQQEVFSFNALLSLRSFLIIVVGGFLVGFGTRWSGGCTSGHGIMGLASLQWPSLVAVVTFFAFGILTSWFLLPLVLSL
ncbi:MAG TPA: YeeE/YedE thiosulfate transporter family protein [Chitinophagales bacterium]|nr:YeeE/YedE thiosulfate transporter family protein [Chitinophagales bacterium]